MSEDINNKDLQNQQDTELAKRYDQLRQHRVTQKLGADGLPINPEDDEFVNLDKYFEGPTGHLDQLRDAMAQAKKRIDDRTLIDETTSTPTDDKETK